MIWCNFDSQSKLNIAAFFLSLFDKRGFTHLLTFTVTTQHQELACFAVDQLENERPAGDDAGASGKKVPEERERERKALRVGDRERTRERPIARKLTQSSSFPCLEDRMNCCFSDVESF